MATSRSTSSSDRRVVVLVVPATPTWAPPGRTPAAWHHALTEDTYELLADLAQVDVAVAVATDLPDDDSAVAAIRDLTWPGTPVYAVPGDNAVLRAIELAGPAAAVVAVSFDVPDLPGLLIGKLFRALGSADLAVTPATDGSLAAIGVNLPIASWVQDAAPIFDTTLAELEALKPRRHALAVGPGWHRMRSAADIAQLDPGLEGWEATRSQLRRP
ncbi:hypothetical protein E1263_12680 [Kribbella antibiotica]|uniref:DUF2064 domain-containing protein n=1 Tax=Kribbella antibiotica TaxID=190195 RepID=A0A4R4ZQ00_9ACTN|nr:hypothetical protein [Kribbella antibiotica]TDD60104.1 hypothetical protein E1263_12680 [Kribbella antibiotica]